AFSWGIAIPIVVSLRIATNAATSSSQMTLISAGEIIGAAFVVGTEPVDVAVKSVSSDAGAKTTDEADRYGIRAWTTHQPNGYAQIPIPPEVSFLRDRLTA